MSHQSRGRTSNSSSYSKRSPQMPFISRTKSKQLEKVYKTQYKKKIKNKKIKHNIHYKISFSSQLYQLSAEPLCNETRNRNGQRSLVLPQGSSQGHFDWFQISHNSVMLLQGCLTMRFPLLSFYHSFQLKSHIHFLTFLYGTTKPPRFTSVFTQHRFSRSKIDLVG